MQRNSRNIPLSHKETAWVNSRGGRDMEYVFKDKSGKFIWMKEGKVYLPKRNWSPNKTKTANKQN